MQGDTPSYTARKVALNVVLLGARPHSARLLPAGCAEATAELLVASGAVRRATVTLAKHPRVAKTADWFDWMMPGQFEGFALRKRFCEREVRRAIEEAGARQVLVLGAGYDTLGWRLAPEAPEVRFFEIDHPSTARVKRRGIEAMAPRDNLHLIAEDLAHERLEDVLVRADGWDVDAPSVVVAEGLLMYLPETAVRELFQQIGTSAGVGSRIAFSYVGLRGGRPDAGPLTALTHAVLKAMGEPWLWGIDPARLGDFLASLGWKRLHAVDGVTRAGIEHLGVATLAERD